tara:strand:- start:249 stop:488 length:240 start_codon:yes stop_codon:yes gene_type:complete
MKDEPHIFVEVDKITQTSVDGNSTHITFEIFYANTETGELKEKEIIMSVPTLELVETFNASWIHHAIGQVKKYLHSLTK